MKKNEIKENCELIKAMKKTYDVFYWNNEEHQRMREGIMREMINLSCNLFEASSKWIYKFRNGYLAFEIIVCLDELSNARFYDKIGYENWEFIEKGIHYIERSVFSK